MVKRGLTFFLNGSGESLFFTLRRAAAFSIFCRPEHVAFRVCQICNHTRCPRLFTGCLVSTFQLTSDACSGFYFPSIGVYLTSHPGDYICIRVEWFRFTRVNVFRFQSDHLFLWNFRYRLGRRCRFLRYCCLIHASSTGHLLNQNLQLADRGGRYRHAGQQTRQLWCCRVQGQGNDSNLLIVFYVQIVPDDFVMQLHRFGERQGLPAQPCQMLSQIQVVSLNSLRVTLTDDVQFSLQT